MGPRVRGDDSFHWVRMAGNPKFTLAERPPARYSRFRRDGRLAA